MKEDAQRQPIMDRRRSGYVRDFNTLDVFIFNVIGFGLGLALSTNPPFIGSFAPSSDIIIVLLLGAVLAVFNGLTYGWFGGIMPSTGGDYVFVSRSLNHRLGFLANWGFTICQIYGLAMNLGWILSVGVAPALMTLGVSINNSALVDLGTKLGSPFYISIGSCVLLVLYFFAAYCEIGLKRYIIYPLFGIGLLGTFIMIAIMWFHTRADFVSSFNVFMDRYNGTKNAYGLALSTAKSSGIVVEPSMKWFSSLKALPLGFLCFLGFTYSVYVGGEVREPQKSQVRGILMALGLGAVVFLLGMGFYVRTVGAEFHSAVGIPAVGEALRLPTNSMNLFAGVLISNPVLNIIMQIGNLLWFLLIPYVILQVCAHNFIAWTCDRLMPQALLARAGKADSPWAALLAVSFLTLLCVIANYIWGFTMVGAVSLAAVAFFLTGIGAVYLPKQRPEIFAKAPQLLQLEICGVSLFQLVGVVSAVGFGWIIYASIRYPEISGGTSERAVAVLCIVYVLGFAIYEIMAKRLKRKMTSVGVNLDDLFKEIPKD